MRMKVRLLADLVLLSLILIAAWRIWIYESPVPDLKNVPSIELSGRYLWDPESPDLRDWQVLGNPTDLILGPADDLFISDGDEAKVLRCRIDGRYVEQVRREMGRQDVYPTFFRSAVWHTPSHLLYVATIDIERNQHVIYGVAPEDLSVRFRYALAEVDSEEMSLDRLAVARGGLEPCFYMIDRRRFGIVVLETTSDHRTERPLR
jgi:hypothetical protein